MNTIPLVSVVVLSYNNKSFLQDCIESILNQDYPNIEIIVSDDCSTDGSQLLLKSLYNSKSDKVKLILNEKNSGITSNSNIALANCSGEYIAWMGGDDLMYSNKIKIQVNFLEVNKDYNICYHNLEVFQSETNNLLYYFNNIRNNHTGGIEKAIKFGTFNGACATMTRKSASPKNGFNQTIPVASDWLYWIENLENFGKIGYINKVLGRYRRHASNVTNKNSSFSTQGQKDLINTCEILFSKYPQYKSAINYRLSIIYRSQRKLEYMINLQKSLKHNMFNLPSLIFLLLYCFSFKKIKL